MKKKLIILFIFITLLSTEGYSQLVNVVANSPTPGICLGNDTQLNVVPSWDSGPGGEVTPVTYLWESIPPTSFFPNNSSLTVWAKPTETTQFIVTATDTKFNIIKKGYLTVIVNYPPVLKIIIPQQDSSSCMNSPVDFFGKTENIKGEPVWSTSGQGQLKVNPEYNLHATYIPAPGETGIITVTITGYPLDYCETASASFSRTLEFVSMPEVSVTPNAATICNSPELPLSLSGSVSTNTTSFGWRVVPESAGTLSNKLVLNPTFMPDPNFTGMVTVILEARNKGCVQSASATVTVTKFTLPIYPEKYPVICKGDQINLEVWNCEGCTYKWNTNETTRKITVSPDVDTEYWTEVKDKQGCVFRDTFFVTVVENPKITRIDLNGPAKTIEVIPDDLETYQFLIKGNAVQTGSDNSFYFGSYIQETNTVDIIVTNEWGCQADTTYSIVPSKPDAFTPNDDGTNDKLIPGWPIIVFDRTQKILYKGSDGWDGTYNGKEMPVGTYFYVLYDWNDKVVYKGPVTLLRESLNN